jgi:hypothetical protein
VIEKAALGRAVDERTDETQLLHGAHELGNGGIGALHRSTAKPAKRSGWRAMAAARWSFIARRHADTIGTRHEVGTGTGVGEHLHRDAGLVHGLQAPLADLGQRIERIGAVERACSRAEAPTADDVRIDATDQGGDGEMLFKRDNTHWCGGLSLPLRFSLPGTIEARRDLLC